MISKQEPQKEYNSEWDDFNQVTEQMSRIVIAIPARSSSLPEEPVLSWPERAVPQLPLANVPVEPVPTRRSPVPVVVGTLFLVLQVLLLLRFALKTLNIPADSLLVQVIYSVSGVFAQAFYVLGQRIPLSFPLETYTLLALLVYGFIARVLVRFLKALLNTD